MRSQKQDFGLFLGENRFFAKHRGWISGSGTSREVLGGGPEIELPELTEPVPAGDFIVDPDAQMHYFAVDRSGKPAWDWSSFTYFDVDVNIVELIPGSASDAFKAHLRSVGVSYIIAGKEELDMAEAVNRSMVRDGLCDEISLVLMPTADGENRTNSQFEANKEFSAPVPIEFSLKNVAPLEDGSVWLRYDVQGPVDDEVPSPASVN